MERCILHCDMNNFYASVECMLNPSLKGYPVAVGGDAENRHGIILAKNYEAKAYGVKTGEALWQAKGKCPNLLIVSPHYEQYMRYSRFARQIYEEYTDRIEPYGMDEVWMDVTGTCALRGNGEKIANEIRERIKFELGLTVSIGVSFNKIFAKLGSDMKKPDAVTCIPRESFKKQVWGLNASEMIGVGRATYRNLERYGIHTIGDLANAPPMFIAKKFGKCGVMLQAFAAGEDRSAVMRGDATVPVKSVGHGITTKEDLDNGAQVWNVMLSLCQDIGYKLRTYGKRAGSVQIDVRDKDLFVKQWQCKLPTPTCGAAIIAKCAFELFSRSYTWQKPIRSVTVRAIDLQREEEPTQFDLFGEGERACRKESLERVVDDIRERYGKYAIMPATLCRDIKMPRERETELRMPTGLLNLS